MILAIDQGTSATKALVIDPAGAVRASAEVAVRPSYLPDGGVEVDPHELLASVLEAGRAALAQANAPIEAVALANQGETVLAWDRATGRPLSPAIVWQDGRAAPICAELAPHRDAVAAKTGLVLDPYFSAPKMAWLRRHVTTEGVVTTSDTWLVRQLTGEFVTDASTASRSLLLDLDRVTWDGELVELFGLADTDLPRIVASDEIVGSTAEFGASVPVAGLIVDQQAALLGQGATSAGAAKCTFGTGAFLLANTGLRAPRSSAGLTTSIAWQLQGRTQYCLDGQVLTAASAVRWLQDLGLIVDATQLDAVALTASADDAVLCVPALAGLAAPWWRSDARATFTGMTLSTNRGDLVLALLRGIAAQVAELADVVAADLGAPLGSLRVDGGLTNCATLMQACADLMQLPIEIYPGGDATAAGAAIAASLALDPARSLEQAPAPVRVGYQPRWAPDRAGDYRARWRALV